MKRRQPGPQTHRAWTICGVLATLLLTGFGQARKTGAVEQPAVHEALVAGAREGYVGSASCSRCHLGISKQYSRTSMGRSMAAVTPELLRTLPTPADFYDEKLDRHFEVRARDGKLYQSEYQRDAAGSEVFRNTHAVEWIIGAGMNGQGALVRQEDYLFQAPLSFYATPGAWGPSPGYEFGDYGFNRPILAGCISCHSGRPRPIPASDGRYEPQPFAEMAIGCENCHGPGAAHIKAMDSESADGEGKGNAIVNPANLSLALADNICMSCHQTGDERVFQEGKTYQDFRPGEPLDKVLAILMVPPKREAPPRADHLEHYYSMTLSKCYRASAGKMGCITCHNPHVEPTREEAPAYFNARCMTCHTQQSCKLPLHARAHGTPANNCIGCHMPKREVRTISHSSVTNHRILARADEEFPESAFPQTTAALPDLIHLDPLPDVKEDRVAPLTLLQAYGELAPNKPEYVALYLTVLARLEETDPDKEMVQAALGRRDLKSGKLQEAVVHLRRAAALGPPQATVYGDLAEAMTKLGEPAEGLALIEKATVLDPFNPVLQKTLVVSYINLKQYPKALAALEHYLAIFPQDSYMRKMLHLAKGASPER